MMGEDRPVEQIVKWDKPRPLYCENPNCGAYLPQHINQYPKGTYTGSAPGWHKNEIRYLCASCVKHGRKTGWHKDRPKEACEKQLEDPARIKMLAECKKLDEEYAVAVGERGGEEQQMAKGPAAKARRGMRSRPPKRRSRKQSRTQLLPKMKPARKIIPRNLSMETDSRLAFS